MTLYRSGLIRNYLYSKKKKEENRKQKQFGACDNCYHVLNNMTTGYYQNVVIPMLTTFKETFMMMTLASEE